MSSKFLNPQVGRCFLIQIRTKIHPTPAKVEFIQGRSAIGKPAAFEPVRMVIEKGKSYSWCSCGASKKQPFCDGSHRKVNETVPEGQDKFAPLRFVCEETRTVHMCMCKSSSNRPFCDGTHQQLAKSS
ncbi:CDGSH iron-sulfur domain-containing mitochondrial [Brachionus plicatilis]|uniref:CDGSH iron-sulfur domain-containing mitochondrial n=1 Tax=Brachionus plicatilis TaxID=10195 RepID=A0A3M7RTQ1_BRAPC|nr:CDGSH iron-sulfur domain-containing mitochondrial [Brachionus plicatilis]